MKITVTGIIPNQQNSSVTIYTSTNKKYIIGYNDYVTLPFSCREESVLDVRDEHLDPETLEEHPCYSGDKNAYLVYLTLKHRLQSSAIRSLAISDQSRKTIFYKLVSAYKKENIDDETLKFAANVVCDELENQGYIDDYRYALEKAIRQKESKNHGPMKIRQYLYEKGVPNDVIKDVLKEDAMLDFSDNIKRLAETKVREAVCSLDKEQLSKLKAFLYRNGYSYDDISRYLRTYD